MFCWNFFSFTSTPHIDWLSLKGLNYSCNLNIDQFYENMTEKGNILFSLQRLIDNQSPVLGT